MPRIPRWFLACLLLLGATSASAVTTVTARLDSGAHIRIAVPDGWEPGDGLVLFQHGFNMEFDTDPDLGPWEDVLLREGYAIGASGYRMAGWALFSAVEDNRDLLDAFRQRFGEPGHLVSMGGSMGGLIALRLAESPGFERIRGVLSVCPPAAGARTWDAAIDLRMAYDAVCAGVGGGELPRSDGPIPWAFARDDIPDDLGDLLDSGAVLRTLARVTQCTGVSLPPLLRSSGQRERLARLMAFGKFTNEDFFVATMGYATFALSDLVRDPLKLGDRNAFTTEGVDYGDAAINAGVPRFRGDAAARYRLHQVSDLTGAIPDQARVVVLHTSKDELVRPVHQRYLALTTDYAAGTAPGGASQLFRALVRETENTHCGFTPAELGAGWSTLKAAMAGAEVRTDDFRTACTAAQATGLAGPCRVDGEPNITEDVAETMRERPNQANAEDSARIAGLWIDPALVGEGFFVEPLEDGRAVVSGYSYPALGDGGEQLWWVGLGRIDGNGITVPDIALYRGPRFQSFHPDDLRAQGFGSATLTFTGLNSAEIRLSVPPRYGRPVRQLARLSAQAPYTGATVLPIPFVEPWSLGGIYVNPARRGEGLILHHMPLIEGDTLNGQRDFLIWYTFDDDGDPMWLVGERQEPVTVGPGLGTWRYRFTLSRPTGTFYPPNFDPSQVVGTPFGTVEIENTSCSAAIVRYDARAGGFGQGTFTADRITRTRHSDCVWE